MNSIQLAYWCLRLVLPLLVLAAALPWIVRLRTRGMQRGAALALASVTVLPNLAAGLDCAWLRFVNGLESCPWLASAVVLLAQLAGSVFLLRRASCEPGALDWPRLLLCMGATVTLALAWTTDVNLDLRQALAATKLELEAGRIAYRAMPPATPESNAAPIYTQLAAQLTGPGGVLDEDRWSDALSPKSTLDPISKELRAAVAQAATALNELRAATSLPRCLFESMDEHDLAPLPPIAMMLSLERALVLEARLRTADGDLAGALADLQAGLRLSAHVEESQLMITALAADVARRQALGGLPRILAAQALRADQLAKFMLPPAKSLSERFREATAMEESYMLSYLARAFARDPNVLSSLSSHGLERLIRPGRDLALRFCFDDQLAGYRRVMVRCAQAGELSPAQFAASSESEATLRAANMYQDGLFAPYLLPRLTSIWIPMRRGAAEVELARAAISAASFRLEHGRYPAKVEELPNLPDSLRWEGDGSFARFIALDPLLENDAPSVDLPPKN